VRLGTLLLRNASIGLSQLESALRNQVLYGGRLGTNLVELGFLEVDLLSSYLSDLTGVPSATPQMLDVAPADALARLGGDLAHQLGAIPLGNTPVRDGSVPVALIDPLDRNALTVLRARFNAPISPYVMPELRAFYYLERHFGQPRQARFVRSGGRATVAASLAASLASAAAASGGPAPGEAALGGDEAGAADRRRVQPPAGMVMPPSLLVPPRRKRASSAPPPLSSEPVVAFAAACDAIDSAAHREQLAETLLSYAKGRLAAMLVFLVRDSRACASRRSRCRSAAPPPFRPPTTRSPPSRARRPHQRARSRPSCGRPSVRPPSPPRSWWCR
jgi:Type II secretion system (T2SS), protein E, N-terminal domain